MTPEQLEKILKKLSKRICCLETNDGGGGGDAFYSANGPLTSDRTVDLDGKLLNFAQGANDFLFIDPTTNSEGTFIQAYNVAGDNTATVKTNTSNTTASYQIIAQFNGSAKEARIDGLANTTDATITYIADDHTFNGSVEVALPASGVFTIESGLDELLRIKTSSFNSTLSATDGTAWSFIDLVGNASGPSAYFELQSFDGTNTVNINGDAVDQTIDLTAVNGVRGKIVPRVITIASSTLYSVNADNCDMLVITALATNITFGAPVGTAINGQSLRMRIKDAGVAKILTFNAIYRAGTDIALPATTVVSETLYLDFVYNDADTTWDFVGKTGGF